MSPRGLLTRYNVVFDVYSTVLYHMSYIVHYIGIALGFGGVIALVYHVLGLLMRLDQLALLASRGELAELARILVGDWVYLFIAALVFRLVARLVARVYDDYVRDRAEAVKSIIEHRVGASASLESVARMIASESEERALPLLRAANVYLAYVSTGSEKESLRIHVDANTGAKFVTLTSVQGVPVAIPSVPETSATQVFSVEEEGEQ